MQYNDGPRRTTRIICCPGIDSLQMVQRGSRGTHPPVEEHLAASEFMCRVAFRLDQRWNEGMIEDRFYNKQFFIEYWVKEHYKNHGYIYMRVPSSDVE